MRESHYVNQSLDIHAVRNMSYNNFTMDGRSPETTLLKNIYNTANRHGPSVCVRLIYQLPDCLGLSDIKSLDNLISARK